MTRQESEVSNFKCPKDGTWLEESRGAYYCPKCMADKYQEYKTKEDGK